MGSSTLIRRDGWKLVEIKDDDFQLYNIKEDNEERHNRADHYPERVSELKAVFMRESLSTRGDL